MATRLGAEAPGHLIDCSLESVDFIEESQVLAWVRNGPIAAALPTGVVVAGVMMGA